MNLAGIPKNYFLCMALFTKDKNKVRKINYLWSLDNYLSQREETLLKDSWRSKNPSEEKKTWWL